MGWLRALPLVLWLTDASATAYFFDATTGDDTVAGTRDFFDQLPDPATVWLPGADARP